MRVCLMLVALVAGGCGSGSSSQDLSVAQDLSSTGGGGDIAVYSLCGHPGDAGNSKGVGKYCTDPAGTQCKNQAASVCSTLMPIQQGPVYFCTLTCDPNATTSTCGENATCTCLSPGACGCVPDTCRVGLFG
jgi:hypothetical protein